MSYKALEDLREKLCKELETISNKGELSASMLDATDKLTRTIKNIDKILAYDEDGGYSMRGYPMRYEPYIEGDGSYARGRRNAKRDERGRYSRDGYRDDRRYRDDGYSRHDGREEYIEHLHELMDDAPDEQTRQEIQRMISKMEKA